MVDVSANQDLRREELFRVYFRNTGILFPFVHEPSFMETYYAFKASNFSKVRRTWLGLLNAILAMASSIDPASKMNAINRGERSSAFYERAVTLCGKSSIKGASLEIVQYLLLASQYLQGTQKSSQTWTLHGLAVKGAYALGLHSNQASQRFSPLENEIRKRTWFGCVLLDRVLSMTFGRPPTIPEEFVRLPLPQPWPRTSKPDFAIPDIQTPSMHFFNSSITLHGLIGMAISRLYGQNLGDDAILSEAELIPRIFELEQELARWQSSLPAELAVVISTALPMPATFRDRTVDRFRTMLTLRYHNLNILVHRPLLCKSLDFLAETIPEVWSNSVSRMTREAVHACLGSAEETINIVHGILTDPSLGSSVLGAWWFTLYYLFNGSLVVFANSLIERSTQPAHFGSRPSTDIDHLNRAIDAFRLLDSDNRIVDRCTEYVEYLLKVLERWSQHGKFNSGNGSYAQRDIGGDPQGDTLQPSVGLGDLSATGGLPDLHDFLKDDLELAQFFASGIFDMQNTGDSVI